MLIKIYCTAFAAFFALDMTWLGWIAKSFYRAEIGHLMRADINWLAAIIFYCAYIWGVTLFVVLPAIEKNSVLYAVGMGAFFGFITYATYDLTNLATLKDWSLTVTLVDLVWGSCLTSVVSWFTFWFLSQRSS